MSDKTQDALSAAVNALGDVMLEMQRRRLLATARTDKAREFLSKGRKGRAVLTDEQIGTLAANAFEAGAMVLAELGYPGAEVFRCNPSKDPA